ncbi:MAG: site-specific integrase [Oscillospiraceae bacterium]|nr:site-specific integrase [Oscillospiraceae bacterium]
MAKAKKLPSGNWRAQYSTGEKNSKGKYIYGSVTMPTEKEANFAALELELKHKEALRNPTGITVSEAMEKYIENKSNVLSPSTIRGYYLIRKNNLKSLSNMKLNKLNNNIIQSAINDESILHKAKTVKNIYGFLSAVLKLYHSDLRLNITLPQPEKKMIALLNERQLAELIKAVEDKSIEIPVLLALWLGLRQSEICGLTWDCIDFENSIITIRQARVMNKDNRLVLKTTKTYSSTRKIKVHDFIMEKIKKLPQKGDFLININGKSIYDNFKNTLKKNRLPDIRFHDLRHLNASVMLMLNIPDKYAMERSGWATNHTMKNVYQHTFSEERKAVDNRIDNYFLRLLSHRLSHE